ncbi:acyl-CoA dehydrogenase family protein [Mycolicibacterium celeriflavum]|uniref:Acyl-CoA dehydrogenase n=1 Tax=Mycolicibacterium celeriflavum TaxID=1249101 RepID=A0A1X0BXQ4_MYCCF|nr:acyl-CoA dehydrogenase family protein [Mycolicibacterium celeriflavum]MCV7237171.1 acyl-CoA dehydrogenase family protein [Mycolicibacterium celeriflavum]ORA49224.1 acyl-CoA dehydrogenase [Mycolicibacterium celeriflavum]BBY41868.1 acyl-CoA dehydrogenase [Mycolicibacterium celeriflavum]
MTVTKEVSERQAREFAEQAREAQWRQPSFGKELFLGRLRLDLVHPHPSGSAESTEQGEAFLARLREFCESQIDAAVIERDAQIPDKVVAGLKELGAFGMKISTEYGGLGLSQVYYNKALMLVGSVHPSLGALLSAHQSIGVPQPISMFGTDEQKRTWLPRCTEEISAFLLTEPDVGSDPARLHATATPEGDDYILNGTKLWTTNGVVADLLVVMAQVPKSEGHRGGISAFVMEADTPGIVVENRNAFMGLRGIENGLTRLTDVRVPAANRIAREGEGLKVALSTLNVGRLSLPAICAGSAKWCLKIAKEWSRERVQWGRPVGEHEAVAGKVAFIAATAYGLEAMLELASELADAKQNDIRIEAALAKLYGSEMAWQIADELVQIRGGRGFETAESLAARGERGVPAEQMLRDMRINRIFEGSTEVMHLLIAREAVDAHLSVAGDVIDPEADLSRKARAAANAGKFYARWLPTLVTGKGQVPTSFGEFGPLATHLRYVERASRRLARSIFYGMSRWQGKLEHKQRFLARIVDIGAELFAMTAVCVRAQRDPEGGSAVELAGAFCEQARVRTEQLFDQLWHNCDDSDRALARGVLDDRFTWLEEGILDPSIDGPWIAQEGGAEKPDVHRVIR